MKLRMLPTALAVCLVLVACGDGDEPAETTRRELDVADAPALFEQDIRNSFENSYRVAYELEVTDENGDAQHCTVEWWKDGTERQRFDMCAPLVAGNDFDSEPWRILMFGDREQILVCSSGLSENLSDPDYYSGGPGACHEDSTGIGDLAGNAVYGLNFPLEYPDTLPTTYFDSVDEILFESVWEETMAGENARCYAGVISDSDGEEIPFEFCYAENGALLYQSSPGDGLTFEYTLRSTSVGDVTAADFELPYPYVDASENE